MPTTPRAVRLTSSQSLDTLRGIQMHQRERRMALQGAYEVHITDQGPPTRPFGWQIVQRQDYRLLARSTESFATAGEAIADAARAEIWRTLGDDRTSSPFQSRS